MILPISCPKLAFSAIIALALIWHSAAFAEADEGEKTFALLEVLYPEDLSSPPEDPEKDQLKKVHLLAKELKGLTGPKSFTDDQKKEIHTYINITGLIGAALEIGGIEAIALNKKWVEPSEVFTLTSPEGPGEYHNTLPKVFAADTPRFEKPQNDDDKDVPVRIWQFACYTWNQWKPVEGDAQLDPIIFVRNQVLGFEAVKTKVDEVRDLLKSSLIERLATYLKDTQNKGELDETFWPNLALAARAHPESYLLNIVGSALSAGPDPQPPISMIIQMARLQLWLESSDFPETCKGSEYEKLTGGLVKLNDFGKQNAEAWAKGEIIEASVITPDGNQIQNTELENQITLLGSKISELEDDLEKEKNEKEKLEKKVSDKDNEIRELQGKVGELEAEIATLKNRNPSPFEKDPQLWKHLAIALAALDVFLISMMVWLLVKSRGQKQGIAKLTSTLNERDDQIKGMVEEHSVSIKNLQNQLALQQTRSPQVSVPINGPASRPYLGSSSSQKERDLEHKLTRANQDNQYLQSKNNDLAIIHQELNSRVARLETLLAQEKEASAKISGELERFQKEQDEILSHCEQDIEQRFQSQITKLKGQVERLQINLESQELEQEQVNAELTAAKQAAELKAAQLMASLNVKTELANQLDTKVGQLEGSVEQLKNEAFDQLPEVFRNEPLRETTSFLLDQAKQMPTCRILISHLQLAHGLVNEIHSTSQSNARRQSEDKLAEQLRHISRQCEALPVALGTDSSWAEGFRMMMIQSLNDWLKQQGLPFRLEAPVVPSQFDAVRMVRRKGERDLLVALQSWILWGSDPTRPRYQAEVETN